MNALDEIDKLVPEPVYLQVDSIEPAVHAPQAPVNVIKPGDDFTSERRGSGLNRTEAGEHFAAERRGGGLNRAEAGQHFGAERPRFYVDPMQNRENLGVLRCIHDSGQLPV